MNVWRSCKKQRINDLSGGGAKKVGGRWNRMGTAVLYTSENHSLSILEALVHFESSNAPSDYFLVEISFPENAGITEIPIKDLPVNWREIPSPDSLKRFGDDWSRSVKTLALSVPSVVDTYGRNYLLNPLHPRYSEVKVIKSLPLTFDERLVD